MVIKFIDQDTNNNKNQRSVQINCSIRIHQEELYDNSKIKHPIYFKIDGGRFKYSNTLKLLASKLTRFEIELKKIQSKVNFVQIRTSDFNDLDQANVDDDYYSSMKMYCQHEDEHSTLVSVPWWHFNPGKRGQRLLVTVVIRFQDSSMLKINFQVRFYARACLHFKLGAMFDSCQVRAIQDYTTGLTFKIDKMAFFSVPEYKMPKLTLPSKDKEHDQDKILYPKDPSQKQQQQQQQQVVI